MVGYKECQNEIPWENGAKARRTIRNRRSIGTSYLQTEDFENMEDPQCVSCNPTKENKIYGKYFPTPPPDLVEGEEAYEVETILNHRKRGRGYQYLIKWAGYPITEASWESEQSFNSDGDMLTSYKQ